MAPTPPFASLRERLRNGPPLIGTFVKLPALEAIDIVASAGFDLAVVDREHSQLVEGDVLRLVRHASARSFPTLIRIPAVDAGAIGRVLEAGAAGIQLSTLRRTADRDALVAATRYAPDGSRSVSLAHPAADYGAEPLERYLDRMKEGPILVGQIETATTVDALPELIGGLDAAFIGSTDLSVDLGLPGQLAHERVRARIREIGAAADAAGIALGVFAGSADAITGMLDDRTPRYVLVGSDLQILRSGAASLLAATRRAIGS